MLCISELRTQMNHGFRPNQPPKCFNNIYSILDRVELEILVVIKQLSFHNYYFLNSHISCWAIDQEKRPPVAEIINQLPTTRMYIYVITVSVEFGIITN